MRRKQRQLDAVGSSKLVEDVSDVPLDGALADGELPRNLLVRVAAQDRPHDVQLAPRESEGFRAPASDVQLAEAGGGVGNRVVTDPALTLHDAVNALEQHVRRRLFGNDADGAELNGGD